MMAQWKKGFRNKKIFRIKERFQKAFGRRTKKTKAVLRREFRKNFIAVREHLIKYNQIGDIREKTRHIKMALMSLEKLLADRPGNHIIRKQYALCREAFLLQSQLETADRGHKVELLLDLDYT